VVGIRARRGAPQAETAILDATRALLAEVPLHELSVAQIIAAAGISRATFYFYFGSKFGVLAALVEHAIAEIYEVNRPAGGRNGNGNGRGAPERALARRISESARVWDEHGDVLAATVENWRAYPELRTLWLEMTAGLTEAISLEIEHERAAGRAPEGPDPHALAATLVWATEHCLYMTGNGARDAVSREDVVDALTSIWTAGIYGGRHTP
jgi:AcrR family transcriptional regulator